MTNKIQISMPMVAALMFDTPLMVEPRKAAIIAQAFAPKLFGNSDGVEIDGVNYSADLDANAVAKKAVPMASLLGEEMANYMVENRRGYGKHNGVAIISIMGTLAHRGAYIGQSSGVTSYEGLRAQIKAAVADTDMKAIALEIDSPGGECAGVFELADLIREARTVKPVYAFLAQNAHSAAYALASQASHITIPEFGSAGSIGILMMHVDQSQALKNAGLKVTVIQSGAKKTEGSSLEALPDAVKEEWQVHSDKLWAKFADTVALGRGSKLDAATALKMEAACFDGADAVAAGLVDSVADPKMAFDAMVAAMNETGIWDGSLFAHGGTVAAAAQIPIILSQPTQKIPLVTLNFPSPDLAGVDPADVISAEVLAAAVLDSGPGHLTRADDVHQTQETKMSKTKLLTGAAVAAVATGLTATADTPGEAVADATAVERDRTSKITLAVGKAGLASTVASRLIAAGTSLADAAMEIIDLSADNKADGGDISNVASAKITGDGRDRMNTGMENALLMRAGMEGGERNEFTGMTMRELARASLMASGVAIPSGGVMAVVGAAFSPSMSAGGGTHTSSDFGNILANVAHKSMLRGFGEAPENFEKFTSIGQLSDFKPSKRVGMDAFQSLPEVAEGAEFKYGTMGDNSESIMLATYGRLFAISRQAVINDDLSAFTTVPSKMGRAARRTVGDLVYALIMANAKMADNVALFHATHKNLAASAGLPSEATINAGITAMATQVGRGKAKEKLNIQAKFLLANPVNRSAVLQSLNSEYAPDNTDKQGTVKQSFAHNTVRDAAEPIFDARITGNNWFLMADPVMFDTIEVAYLDGITSPFLEQQTGWSVDGTEFKVRLDAAVAALAWEAIYMNAGS